MISANVRGMNRHDVPSVARWLSVSLVCLLFSTTRTVNGDGFPELYNSEADASAEPMPAEIAAASLQVPDGFNVSVFAAEPEVQNPIGMTWDANGRLWIAENYTYAERSQRFDLSLRDRVVVLEDSDGDGTADRRTVFTDQVQMLTSVEVGHGGVWLMCPPQLLFVPDRDHDAVPDGPPEVVLDGFEVAKANYHNFANGLRWGPDGWLYGRCGGSCPGRIGVPGTADEQRVALEGGIWRYHPQHRSVEVLTHGTTNPWGHDWNAFGEAFFVNTVNGHLWHLIPGAHLKRPFTLDPNQRAYELIEMHADHWHFDTGKSWQDSRDGAANSLGGGHAHSGTMIYLGDNWPARYRGKLLTLNFHGRRANQEILNRDGSGYTASHGDDLLISGDPFFRGIDLSYGPDGSVLVIDWSDTGECHENTGVHRTSGRVFRVAYGDATNPGSATGVGLRDLSSNQLVDMHRKPNEWFVRQARLVLAERAAAGTDIDSATAALRQMVTGSSELESCRALLTLHATGGTDRAFLTEQLQHSSEHLRTWAVRMLSDRWPIDDVFGPVAQTPQHAARVQAEAEELIETLCELGRTEPSGLVRLALASTLQRLPVSLRPALARVLIARAADADDHNLPLLVWYGLMPVTDAQPMALAELVDQCRWPKTQRLIARALAEEPGEHPAAIERLLVAITNSKEPQIQQNILAGIADGMKGRRKVDRPRHWDAVERAVTANGDGAAEQLVRELSVVFGDGRALEEVRQIVLNESAEIGLRRSALKTLVTSRSDDLREICMQVLDDARLNAIAARGLSQYDDPQIGEQLVRTYHRFRAPERPEIIALLVSRPAFAQTLLDAVADGKIPATDLTAFDVRQIRSLQDDGLSERVRTLWGEVRQSPADKESRIDDLKKKLGADAFASADSSQGRVLFQQTCAKCHRLFGEGEAIGPDLTGANRSNLDYLLENIVDPSAVVTKNFQMTVVVLNDGRVMNGLVIAENDHAITLQTQTDQQVIAREDVEIMKPTNQSPMPDGLLDNLTSEQIRNLVAYLMHPSQVPLPAASD